MAVPDYISSDLRAVSYFDFKTLRTATKNFHPRNQLGRGGFGPVYEVLVVEDLFICISYVGTSL